MKEKTVQGYLEKELTESSFYEISEQDLNDLKLLGLGNFIYKKVVNKHFRKWMLDSESADYINATIISRVAESKPLLFTFPFGGYKLWRVPTAPEVDWAEFFSISYYLKWLAPIAAVYKPGVIFSFSSDDIIIERMNNVCKADTDAYFTSFSTLLERFRVYLPDNIKMDIVRIGDLYNKKEFENELAKNVKQVKYEYKNPESVRYEKMLVTSRLNINFSGEKDLSKLSDIEKDAMIKMGPIYHDAYGSLSKRREFVRGKGKIVVFTTRIPNAIALGTTKTSIAKFWTGIGVIEKRDNNFFSRILSPQQIEQSQKLSCENVFTNLLPLRNFQSITSYNDFHLMLDRGSR